jgi:uncharacterized protein YeaO (DUF488 family)
MTFEYKNRTTQQSRAIHLYLEQLAEELDKKGVTIQDVVREIKKAEIRPTMELLKAILWKPIQWIMFKKKSTTELKVVGEIDRVYDVINKFVAERWEVCVPFPSQEELAKQDDTFIKN